jgi:hypothetical protein
MSRIESDEGDPVAMYSAKTSQIGVNQILSDGIAV